MWAPVLCPTCEASTAVAAPLRSLAPPTPRWAARALDELESAVRRPEWPGPAPVVEAQVEVSRLTEAK